MRDKPAATTSYRLIARAAELLLKCAGYLDDSNAAISGDDEHRLDTFYAIDTDVIALYLEPESMVGYSDVFGEEANSSTRKYLAFLLGDFLITASQSLLPGRDKQHCRFLLIPPHDEELLRMLTAIHRKLRSVGDGVNTATFEDLSAVFAEYEQNRNEETLLRNLRRRVPDLVELFNPYRGPKAALTRYALLPDTTFQRIDTYFDNEFTFPLLDPINDKEDRERADELIEQWVARLQRRKVRNKPAYALQGDAEVLATLEYVNSKLRDTRKQVVLVTGSNYLFEAGDEYRPWQGELTFSDMYLRHPQAFLAHPKFFSAPSTSEASLPPRAENAPFKLIDWLNLFFPSELRPAIQPQGVVRRALLRKIRSGEDSNVENLIEVLSRPDKGVQPIEHLLEGWKTQVTSAAEERYADGLNLSEERGANELAKTLSELRRKSDWSVDKLRALVFKESLGSVSTLYSTTVWVGLWSSAAREQSKGVPALRFDDSWSVAEKYCHDVIKLQLDSINKNVSKDNLKRLLELNDNVVKLDDSLYHAHVVHALAFATKGHWYATLTLANTAMAICDNMDPKTRKFRLGREAAYLACIAARRSAKNRSGLAEARKYLEEAIKRENEGVLEEDIRFTAERLALTTRFHYFGYFCESRSLDIQLVLDTLDSLHRLVESSENEKSLWVKHWVRRQTLTNYFTLLLMVRDVKHSDNVSDVENIRKDIKVFQMVLEDVATHGLKPDDDPYAHLVCNICTAIWDLDPQKREQAKVVAFQSVSGQSPSFMPYDEERFKLMKRSIPARRTQL